MKKFLSTISCVVIGVLTIVRSEVAAFNTRRILEKGLIQNKYFERRRKRRCKPLSFTEHTDTGETEALIFSGKDSSSAISLQEEAQKLRLEADAMRAQIEEQKAKALEERTAKIDGWIDQLLISVQVDDKTQLLRSQDEVLQRLKEDRFSQEQINAIFNRLCEIGTESRSTCSPLMELLVDSVGKMDSVERDEQPNKRWSGKVERTLRRRLFAMDWNMDIDDEGEDEMNPWRLR